MKKNPLSRIFQADLHSVATAGLLVVLLLVLAFIIAKPLLYGILLPPQITLPEFTSDVLLCSQEAKQEFDGRLSLDAAIETGDPYRPFQFEYEFLGADGTLQLSADPAFESYREYPMPRSETAVTIDNLLVDTTYYYRVLVKGEVYEGSFHTALSTRFLSVPGLINTRDIGGGTNMNGQRIRQGLLIRGVELDGLQNPPFYLSPEDVPLFQDTFGFVFDLDLREEALFEEDYTSPLGIRHRFYTAPMYSEIFTDEFKDSLLEIFTDLADPDNYPMYLHCTWGRDRTGTVVYLLQGILNMSEEDMLREYMLSAYAYPALIDTDYMSLITDGLQDYEGRTIQEKIVTFLTTDIGITQEQIETIREIFLEP